MLVIVVIVEVVMDGVCVWGCVRLARGLVMVVIVEVVMVGCVGVGLLWW